MSAETKKARLERVFRQRAMPEAAALLPGLDEIAARPGLIWRYDPELGIRASCTAATPTITTGGAGTAGDAWTDDGEPDHLRPVALLAMRGEAETAEHLERVRTVLELPGRLGRTRVPWTRALQKGVPLRRFRSRTRACADGRLFALAKALTQARREEGDAGSSAGVRPVGGRARWCGHGRAAGGARGRGAVGPSSGSWSSSRP